MTEERITLDEWKARLAVLDPGVTYRSTGEFGWDRLDFDEKGPKYVHEDGPYWIDACPAYGTLLSRLGRLLGTYNVKTGVATFF